MKRLIVMTALFSVGVLLFSIVSEAYASSPPETKRDRSSIYLDDEIDLLPKAIKPGGLVPLVTCEDVKIAPVFDATGAVVSDPTSTLLNANPSRNRIIPVTCPDVKIAPVFDTTGAVVSDPTGTMIEGDPSGDVPVQAMGSDVKIAPVFDATGRIVSDPTGTLLSVADR
jgi:hypothetical protein